MDVRSYWERMEQFRLSRNRCKRYCYGDQWSDRVMVDGQWMREEQYIRSQGSEPLKNNLIRRLVKQVIGLYRAERQQLTGAAALPDISKEMKSMLERVRRDNCADELDARMLEEFLISGLAVQRKTGGWRDGRLGCWTDNVRPDLFFVNSDMCDVRGWDVECVGEIHDMRFEALCEEFARSADDIHRLAAIYSQTDYRGRVQVMLGDFGRSTALAPTFFFPASARHCRVIEVWHRERRPGFLCHHRDQGALSWVDALAPDTDGASASDRLWTVCEEWRCTFLSPFGDVLAERVSPYLHGSHPYVFKAYPFIDGEIHSFVADVIDQQRYANRLITLYDWVMRSSAKGVLLVPEECIPDGYSLADVADEWARFNGVIAVKTRNGAMMPQQIAANAVNIGINELLQTQLNLMEDISGVTGALQGKSSNTGMSGTLYEQQTHNATLSQLDMLDSFRQFIQAGENKDLDNIRQFCQPNSYIQSPANFAVSDDKT